LVGALQPLQEATVELVTSASWQAHLRSLAAAPRQRAERLVVALSKDLPESPSSGLAGGANLWLRAAPTLGRHQHRRTGSGQRGYRHSWRIFTIGEPDYSHLGLSFAVILAEQIPERSRRNG
jgi:DNA-binding transcriptional MocR family regulator